MRGGDSFAKLRKMEIHNPGDYSAADAFALAMLLMMMLSMGMIALLFYTIRRSAQKRNTAVDDLLEEVTRDSKEEPAATPGKPTLEAWEKEPDWWKKSK